MNENGRFLRIFEFLFYLPKYFAKKIFYLLLHPMKIVPTRFLILLALLLPVVGSYGAPGDPPPPTPPPPPGLPIDTGLVFLMMAAIGLGLYKVYRHSLKKAS